MVRKKSMFVVSGLPLSVCSELEGVLLSKGYASLTESHLEAFW